MLTRFFIDRPISASAVAIMMVLAGLIAMPLLPIALYPPITPPTIVVTASYSGANAQTMVDAVTTPIENQINGVEGMVSVASTSTDTGSMTIVVTFEVGYDLDIAAVDVQNRVVLAYPYLPDEVINNGISIQKGAEDLVMFINLVSPDKSLSPEFVSSYASINVVNAVKRIPGVGTIEQIGQRIYAMRVWVDTEKLAGYKLTVNDVIDAIEDQNTPAAVGTLGGAPAREGQAVALVLQTKGRLSDVEEFENIIVSRADNGSLIYIKDVARVEMGSASYSTDLAVSGHTAIGIGVNQYPTANTVDISNQIHALLEELQPKMPKGMTYWTTRDSKDFIVMAMKEVVFTLFMALILIVLVAYIFLQDVRATLITLVTIPVSLIGTFALIALLGFSINMLTLFGLILAIGLVVDDAVVVIENISRVMRDEKLPPREATIRAMNEVRGPIIASTLVMMAVFIPASFMPGISGRLYQQFALTIACSLALSLINALTFTPALSTFVLEHGHNQKKGWFFTKFNQGYEGLLKRYDALVKKVIPKHVLMSTLFVILVGITGVLLTTVPRGFIPVEDQGFFYINVQMPEGSSKQRTGELLKKVSDYVRTLPGVDQAVMVNGFSILSRESNSNLGLVVANLKNFDQRKVSAFELIDRVEEKVKEFEDAEFVVLNAPAVQGLSAAGGFEYVLEDRSAQGLQALYSNTRRLIEAAEYEAPEITGLFSSFEINTPILYLDIDREKVLRQGVALSDLYLALQASLGGFYINQFNKYGQVYSVYIQADKDKRSDASDLETVYVRNADGNMIPVVDLMDYEYKAGVSKISRYNLYNATHIIGSASDGHTSGEAIKAMEKLSKKYLTGGFDFEWTNTAYQEEKAGDAAPIIFVLSVLVIFLILSVLYESWLLPLMILLAIPLAVLGALTFQATRGLANDVFCQIAIIMLIGLSAKNAILIVQFANEKYAEGAEVVESVIYACNTRLRPILMTALAFMAGIFPLLIASGAGAAGRQSLGTAVFGGMLFSTFLTLIFIPVVYVVVQRLRERHVPDLREKTRKKEIH